MSKAWSGGAALNRGLLALGRMDLLAGQDTPVHRIDARAKVVATFVFLVCVVSFSKYEVSAMLPFVLFPVAMSAVGGLPLGFMATRLLIAAPFAIIVGMFNPLLDQAAVATVGSLEISGGWLSFLSIVLRFLLTTAAAIALIATTGLFSVSAALQRLGVPSVFTTQLLLLYRYIFVLAEEVMRLGRARTLRSFGRRGLGIHVYGQILGNLLLRTYGRGQRVYQAMLCRGFTGRMSAQGRGKWMGRGTGAARGALRESAAGPSFGARDAAFVLGWSGLFILFRLVDIPLAVGTLMVGTRFAGALMVGLVEVV